MTMFKGVRMFIRLSILVILLLTWFIIAHAADTPLVPVDSISSKDIIMILFGLLQTVFMGIGIWLISNDKELFTRMGQAESKINTREALCEQRNESTPIHGHQRASDTNSEVALKETVDSLRKLLYEMTLNKPKET